MKENLKINDFIVEEIRDKRIRAFIKNFLIKTFIWLKNTNPFTRGMMIITGQVRDEVFDPKTGKITRTIYPIHVANFNTILSDLKYNIAKWIRASNASEFVSANGLMTQASSTNKDGICLTISAQYEPTTTTVDSGGTGSEDNVVFKSVRTAAGSETITACQLGVNYDGGSGGTFDYNYANQTLSKSLTVGQVYTIYWTFTIS